MTPVEDDDGQSAYYAARATLTARYGHLVLKFTPAYLSASGQHEASWIGGAVSAGTGHELLALVRAGMGDCGGDDHLWVTQDISRDPADSDNVLVSQTLKCPGCPAQERVITLCHPQPTPAETSRESAGAAPGADSGVVNSPAPAQTGNGHAAGSSRTGRKPNA